MRARAAIGVVLAVCAAASGCGAVDGGHAAVLARPHPARPAVPSATRPGTPSPRLTPPRRTTAPARHPAPSPAAASLRPGRQLITVTAPSYGAAYATFTAYSANVASGGRWRPVLGPWTARLGNGGLAPPGRKREGDGRTPSGTFGFGFFFGVQPDPGVAFRYRQSHPYDVWDDDPSSPRYNEWVDDRHADPGTSPEPMFVSGYDYGAVIGYNTARTPGLGSAIFLHVNIGRATTGCVTLPEDKLLRVLRWLRPGDSPRIRLEVSGTG